MSDARWNDPREYDARHLGDDLPRVYDTRDRHDRDPRDALMRDLDLPRSRAVGALEPSPRRPRRDAAQRARLPPSSSSVVTQTNGPDLSRPSRGRAWR